MLNLATLIREIKTNKQKVAVQFSYREACRNVVNNNDY